jgi:gamma-glutamylcyclotransferase (GGCT)/AIG2-like uncharacterized protein YtfP
MDSSYMNDKLWNEFKNLIFKWSYEKNQGLEPFYDFMNIYQHPFYSFISSCIIFKLSTIYNPTLFLSKTKDQILYLDFFLSHYHLLKKKENQLKKIEELIDNNETTIQDIKRILNDTQNDNKKNFTRRIKGDKKIISVKSNNNLPIFIYPGKLPSKKVWGEIYDKQNALGNITPGKKSGQTNKRLRSYKNYLYSFRGNNDKEIVTKFYLNNDEKFEELDADQRKKKYDLISTNRKNLIEKLNLIEKKR